MKCLYLLLNCPSADKYILWLSQINGDRVGFYRQVAVENPTVFANPKPDTSGLPDHEEAEVPKHGPVHVPGSAVQHLVLPTDKSASGWPYIRLYQIRVEENAAGRAEYFAVSHFDGQAVAD